MAKKKKKDLIELGLESEEQAYARRSREATEKAFTTFRKTELRRIKRENARRAKIGLELLPIPKKIVPLHRQPQSKGPQLSLVERIALENQQKIVMNQTPQTIAAKQTFWMMYDANPNAYARRLYAMRTFTDNETVRIPDNWPELFGPFLMNSAIRSSYVTKAVGMCSIRALFDFFNQEFKKAHPAGKPYFESKEPNRKAMSAGSKAHKEYENYINTVFEMLAMYGYPVSDKFEDFLSDEGINVKVQEKRLEAKILLPGLLDTIMLSGTPDLVFGKSGEGRRKFMTEAKTHVSNYSAQYLQGCFAQTLMYAMLFDHNFRKGLVTPFVAYDSDVHLLIVESKMPYGPKDFEPLVVKDDSSAFLGNIREKIQQEVEAPTQTRVEVAYGPACQGLAYRTLADVAIHRFNPRLFDGVSDPKICETRFGGCKYRTGCPQYQKTKAAQGKKLPTV